MSQVRYKQPIAEDATSAVVWHYCPRRVVSGRSRKEFFTATYERPTGRMKSLESKDGKDSANVLSELVHSVVERDTEKLGPCADCGVELFLSWSRNRLEVESTVPGVGGLP